LITNRGNSITVLNTSIVFVGKTICNNRTLGKVNVLKLGTTKADLVEERETLERGVVSSNPGS